MDIGLIARLDFGKLNAMQKELLMLLGLPLPLAMACLTVFLTALTISIDMP